MELDREDFRQWLVAKEPDERANYQPGCPIMSWLEDATGEQWFVGHSVFGNRKRPSMPIPTWVARFVDAVDGTGWSAGKLTAKAALTTLDGIE